MKSKFKLLKHTVKQMVCSIHPDNKIQFTQMLLKSILQTIEANLSGPKRPQDLIPLSQMKKAFHEAISAPMGTKVLV